MDLGLDEVWPAQQDTWPCDRDLHEDDEVDGELDDDGEDIVFTLIIIFSSVHQKLHSLFHKGDLPLKQQTNVDEYNL